MPRSHPLIVIVSLVLAGSGCRSDGPSRVPTELPPAASTVVAPEAAPREEPPPQADPATLAAPLASAAAMAVFGAPPRPVAVARRLLLAQQPARVVQVLRHALPTYTDPDAILVGNYLMGQALLRLADPAALSYLRLLPDPLPPIDEARLFALGRAAVLAGDLAAAQAYLGLLRQRFPESASLHALRLEVAEHLHSAGDTESALSLIDAVIAAKPSRAKSARALRARADWLRASAPARSRAAERRLLLEFPAQPEAQAPGLSLSVADLSDAERFARAKHLMRRWDYVPAREELRLLAEHPRFGDEARWLVAQISASNYRDDPDEALAIYRDFASRAGPRREDATYFVGRTLTRQERHEEALDAIEDYARRYPRGKHMQKVRYLRGWLRFELRRCEEAEPHLAAYGRAHNDSAVKGFYAWCKIRRGAWREAIDAFEDLVPYGNPIVRGKAWYWQAYALHQLGDTEAALAKLDRLHQAYPVTYYDVLAHQLRAAWAGRDPRASAIPMWQGDFDPPDVDHQEQWSLPKLSGQTARRFAEVQRALDFAEVERARALYRPLRKSVEAAVPKGRLDAFRAFMGSQIEDYHADWQRASGGVRAMSGLMPERDQPRWHLAYPRAFRHLLEGLEEDFGVPAHFVYAIMLQESRFRPWQISSADALGALQMIPATARAVAAELGTVFDPDTFFDPRVGFPFSVHYMRKHLDLWRGNLTMTAGSYNGGPHRVGPWMLRDRGATMDFLVEEFSYDESRHYARKVAEHTLRYLYLYEGDAQRRAAVLDALFPVRVDTPPDDTDFGY